MQQHQLASLKNTYNMFSALLRGIKRYETLHRGYSSDMKMVLLTDKLALMLIAANQFMHCEISTKIEQAEKEGPIPPEILNNFDKLTIEIDEAFDSVLSDLKELIGKMGNIDSLYERIDQKLDVILASPDYVPGQKMMNNTKQHFEKASQ